jgi:hypothetical protein
LTRSVRVGVAVALAAIMLVPASAGAATRSPEVSGFYQGRTIKYLDFGPVRLASGNKVAPIWAVTNGVRNQHNIIDVVPGRRNYTPLWRVTMVTFKPGVRKTVIRSAGQVKALERAGKVRLRRTNTIVNCPVLGFGQKRVSGFYRGDPVRYLDLGPVKLASGNDVAPLWTVTNGTSEQHNIIDVVPGDEGYSPLWSINEVTWQPGVTPRTLKSRADVEAATAAGELTVKRTNTIVNCPVI